MIMRAQAGSRVRLWSSIVIGAKLNTSLTKLAAALGEIRAMKLVERGSSLRYLILGNQDMMLEFCTDKACAVYYSEAPSIADRLSASVVLLSVLAYTKGLYTVNFESAYETLIDILRQCAQLAGKYREKDTDGADRLAARIRALTASNAAIAHDVIALREEKMSAEAMRDAYRELALRIAREFYYGKIESAAAELGLSKEILDMIHGHEERVEHA